MDAEKNKESIELLSAIPAESHLMCHRFQIHYILWYFRNHKFAWKQFYKHHHEAPERNLLRSELPNYSITKYKQTTFPRRLLQYAIIFKVRLAEFLDDIYVKRNFRRFSLLESRGFLTT